MKTRHILALAILGAACSGEPDSSPPPEAVSAPARSFVEAFVPRFEGAALQRIHSVAVREALEDVLQEEAARPWGARLDGGVKYADLLVEEYRDRAWTLHYAKPSGLNDRGAALVRRLKQAPEDALDPGPYHIDRIDGLDRLLRHREPPPPPSFELSGEEAEEAVRWLAEHGGPEPGERGRGLVDAILGIGEQRPLSERLGERYRTYRDQIGEDVVPIAELEARVSDGALRMSRDLKHFNYRRLSWAALDERGGGKAVVYDRLRGTFADLTEADPDSIPGVIDALRPPHPQYDLLLTALDRYRAFERAGGWETVTPVDLSADANGPEVAALAERLATEGYLDDAGGDEVTPELLAAVEEYQVAHQFRPGPPTAGFWRSLNVSAGRRLAEIELTLQRYRESYYRGEEDFVFVNIPDFHAEVWRNGKRELRFRVVVGNNDRVCDPETEEWFYPNATPVQWATLDYLMLNPWWNVPSRIFEEEIAEHADDTDWLEAKGYELWVDDDGDIRARQRPGQKNALGRVKFIFPNEHNTYMHDTPHKKYFDYPVRTFSHGCVRVERPLELATYFMTTYELGGRARLDRIMELERTIKVELEHEIPVFFEYYTVRVDDDGDVQFLADPYRIYKRALADDPAEITACTVEDDDETTDDSVPDDGPANLGTDHGP